MNISQQIVEYANSLFDVAVVSRFSDRESLLILGLESTPERDLDEFGRADGQIQMYGFEKHIGPKLESVLDFIRAKGSSAEPIGRCGYPRKGEVNLKDKAISAGLGKRGKSTVVLHPDYGTRLRFAAIRIGAALEPIISYSPPPEDQSPYCAGCSICIDICPVNALEPYRMPDTSICLSNMTLIAEKQGRLIPCDICLHQCPADQRRS